MKVSSRKTKPPVGMELTVTLSMPVGATPEESTKALLAFLEGVSQLANNTDACWTRLRCEGIPEELEERLQAGIDEAQAVMDAKYPRPRLIVDNAPRGT